MRQFRNRQFQVRQFEIRQFDLVQVVPVRTGSPANSTWHKNAHTYGQLTVKGPNWGASLPSPEVKKRIRKRKKKEAEERDEDEGLAMILLDL